MTRREPTPRNSASPACCSDARHDSAVRGFSEPGVDTPCLIPWRFTFIQEHTRKVFACPYHRVPYGDLTRASLAEIWNGDTSQAMRRSLADHQIPKFCLDHSAGCPLVMEAKAGGIEDAQVVDDVVVGVNDAWSFVAGWHSLEYVPDAVRWTSGTAEFVIRATERRLIRVDAAVWGDHVGDERTISGRVFLGREAIGSFALRRTGWQVLRFPVPEAVEAGAPTTGRS